MMLVKHWFALSNKCRYHHHKQSLTHPMSFIAKILFLMQWITINCVDFPNVKFHSCNPWLRNLYVLPLSKRINALQNTHLLKKSKQIKPYINMYRYIYVPGIKWWVCAMQTNTGLFVWFLFFILSALCQMEKSV